MIENKDINTYNLFMLKVIKNTKINWWKTAFITFVALYALTMLIKPNFGGPQDDFMLLRTIQNGIPILYYTNPPPGFPIGDVTKLGRFTVLGIMEYNLLTFFFKSPSAFWYFLFHAFEYVLLMALFAQILSKFTSNKILIYLTPIIFSLFPGTALTFFRTHLVERNVIFYYAIFLYFFLKYTEKPKLYYLVLGVIGANMAIHYKEIGFIAVGAFAFFHLILSWKKSGRGLKIFDGLVLLGCLAYLLLYYFIVFIHLPPHPHLYGQTPYSLLTVIVKLLLNYGFFSDPILIFILLPFTAWRIYKALRKKLELHPVYDSMLIAASMYVFSYFTLKMFSPYYLVPAYIFALPPLIYFFSQKEARTIFWKSAAGLCGGLLIFNVFPAGMHYLTYYKYLPLNFNKTLDFLIQDINYRYPNKRASIFIDGVDPSTGGGIYFMDAEFLQYKGLSWTRFDLKSDVKIRDAFLENIKNFNVPFSVFQDKFSKISKGDYLIVTPRGTTKNIDEAYIKSLEKDYDLVFRTKSPLAFPSFDLKTLAKYILSKNTSQTEREKGLMINENLMNWPDYYVFIKR